MSATADLLPCDGCKCNRIVHDIDDNTEKMTEKSGWDVCYATKKEAWEAKGDVIGLVDEKKNTKWMIHS